VGVRERDEGGGEVKIFVVRDFARPHLGGNFNMRQLLNPLFFSHDVRHPDATRQRCARQRAKDLAATRQLKMQYVPLCNVDRTVYIPDYYDYVRGGWRWRRVEVAL
jgi:hypothetical protein